MSGFHHQHVVSRVLLARFTDATGELRAVDLGERRDFVTGPSAVGAVSDFISHDRQGAEERWGAIETRAQSAFDAVDNGSALDSTETVELLKDLLALHWGRSHAIRIIYEQGIRKLLDAQQIEMLSDDSLPEVFTELTGGLVAAGPGALEYAAEKMRLLVEGEFASGEFFAGRVLANVEKAKSKLVDYNLEICVTEEGEFLLGDNPAATLRGGHSGVGPLGGVPWEDADTLMLPLGPKHVLGVRSGAPAWHSFSPDQANQLNRAQILGTVRHVFLKPDGELLPWIRSELGWEG